ncbi:hypothetical protein Gasu2_43120 [Galdieria sulphuraria]|uniref:Uncharacterized protein n=1 Tax=Galdieria sulphuraria TaxID=130081 RepID=M2WR33_GALSU|nr:uncharacterized protein Gasu_60900 [Galdieria sulphuraria]EME26265.1 hypothetical protein Gasu_60900 [Galdieria sulphuraria]GJD10098.1 hypothetical protein Gasu2_43120 [Galdieria sulphuraria]|eukprot:XP_005702785.1 hypothetical protein Gasu_60900 [Galdieria sulphuraria]
MQREQLHPTRRIFCPAYPPLENEFLVLYVFRSHFYFFRLEFFLEASLLDKYLLDPRKSVFPYSKKLVERNLVFNEGQPIFS